MDKEESLKMCIRRTIDEHSKVEKQRLTSLTWRVDMFVDLVKTYEAFVEYT